MIKAKRLKWLIEALNEQRDYPLTGVLVKKNDKSSLLTKKLD